MNQQLHPVYIAILKTLRRTTTARFSELMRATDLESDNFKFYLRNMTKEGWVEKTPEGDYHLTSTGKTFANNLSDEVRTVLKQPKLSVLMVVTRLQEDGTRQFLLQKRARHPFYGFWGFLSGPINWGELPEQTATHELLKQTGLAATFTVSGLYRQRTYQTETGKLFEDGLFTVMHGESTEGSLTGEWKGGDNRWFSEEEVRNLQPKFKETDELLASLDDPPFYQERTVSYAPNEY